MKKMMSVFLFFVTLSVLIMPISAQADSTTPPAIEMDVPAFEPDVFVSESIVYAFEINVFASLVNDGTSAINPSTVEVLYDLSGNPSFLLADIVPHGFAIMFRDAAEISEMTTSEGVTNPFVAARGRKIYAGPMMYIDFYDGAYRELLRDRELNQGDVRHMRTTTDNVLNNLPEPSPIRPFAFTGERRIRNQSFVMNAGFGRNTNLTCGQIAASIILVYFEKVERANGRPRYRVVPSHLFPPNRERDEALHNVMIDHTSVTDTGRTTAAMVRTGLNNYFNDSAHPARRALMMNASLSGGNALNRAVDEIRADRPSIVLTSDRPGSDFGSNINFGRHWYVAYGYRSIGGIVTHLVVHTGLWNSDLTPWNEAEVHADWFVDIVTVRPPIAPPLPPPLRLDINRTINLQRYVILSFNRGRDTWTTSNSNVATVYTNGLVRAVAPGVVTITHLNGDDNHRRNFNFIVSAPMTRITLPRLPTHERRLRVNRNGTNGTTLQLTPTLTPHNSTSVPLRWTSDNPRVATVSQHGLVTARGHGRARITVTDSNLRRSATTIVSVAYNPEVITFSHRGNQVPMNVDVPVNGRFRPRIEFTPDRSRGLCRNARDITWASSNTNVATVDPRGNIRAVAPGTAIITARTVNNQVSSVLVRGVIPVRTVSINTLAPVQRDSLTIDANGRIGTSLMLHTTISPSNATNRNLTWTSSDPNVLIVNDSGFVTARGVGRATITVTTEATSTQRARRARISLRVTRR